MTREKDFDNPSILQEAIYNAENIEAVLEILEHIAFRVSELYSDVIDEEGYNGKRNVRHILDDIMDRLDILEGKNNEK